MIQCKAETAQGELLDLTASTSFLLTEVTGLHPPQADINTTALCLQDGVLFNSSRINERNIVLTIAPYRNVETVRVNLYQYFRVKQYIKLYFKTRNYNVFAEGYVETVEINPYEADQRMQISVICPDSYFYSTLEHNEQWDSCIDGFQFPLPNGLAIPESGVAMSIVNTSDNITFINEGLESGIVITAVFRGDASYLTLQNVYTDEIITINHSFIAGDILTVNTNEAHRSVTLTRASQTTSIINSFDMSTKWLTINQGANSFKVISDAVSNVDVTISYHSKYLGI